MANVRKQMNANLQRLNFSGIIFITDAFENVVAGEEFVIEKVEPIAPWFCEGEAEGFKATADKPEDLVGCAEPGVWRVMSCEVPWRSGEPSMAGIFCTSCMLTTLAKNQRIIAGAITIDPEEGDER